MDTPVEASYANRWLIRAALSATVGLLVVSLAALGKSAWSHIPPPMNPASPAGWLSPLEISPDPVSLGLVTPGRSERAIVTLRNPGPQQLAIARVETSCPCVRVEPVMVVIGAGKSTALTVVFDPSHDPDFRGRLSVIVTGYDETEKTVLRTRVNLEVSTDLSKQSGGGGMRASTGEEGTLPGTPHWQW